MLLWNFHLLSQTCSFFVKAYTALIPQSTSLLMLCSSNRNNPLTWFLLILYSGISNMQILSCRLLYSTFAGCFPEKCILFMAHVDTAGSNFPSHAQQFGEACHTAVCKSNHAGLLFQRAPQPMGPFYCLGR